MILEKKVTINLQRLVLLTCFPIFYLCQACVNTELGKRLSESFDLPAESSLNEGKRIQQNVNNLVKNKSPVLKTTPIKDKAIEIKTLPRKKENVSKVLSSKKIQSPQPYRITIKLLKADPAGPAEGVTQALRMVGIKFEVEKIERLGVAQFSSQSNFERRRGVKP